MAQITNEHGTYDTLFPSIENPDGRIFQILIADHETGEIVCDMEATVAAAKAAMEG